MTDTFRESTTIFATLHYIVGFYFFEQHYCYSRLHANCSVNCPNRPEVIFCFFYFGIFMLSRPQPLNKTNLIRKASIAISSMDCHQRYVMPGPHSKSALLLWLWTCGACVPHSSCFWCYCSWYTTVWSMNSTDFPLFALLYNECYWFAPLSSTPVSVYFSEKLVLLLIAHNFNLADIYMVGIFGE